MPTKMSIAANHFDALAEHAEAWKKDHHDAMLCRVVEDMVDVTLGLHDSLMHMLRRASASDDRDRRRDLIIGLRKAERAFAAVGVCVRNMEQLGLKGDRSADFHAAHRAVRGELLRPTATRMAARDDHGWFVDQLIEFMVDRVEFRDGRAVFTPEVMAELPCPFDAEKVA